MLFAPVSVKGVPSLSSNLKYLQTQIASIAPKIKTTLSQSRAIPISRLSIVLSASMSNLCRSSPNGSLSAIKLTLPATNVKAIATKLDTITIFVSV